MIRLRANLSLFILLTLALYPSLAYAQQPTTVQIFGFAELPTTESLLGYFSRSECQAVLHNLNDSSQERFLRIVETLRVLGVQVTPPELCIQCELLHLTWNEILIGYGSPLIGFFRNGRLTAITLGITRFEVLDRALAARDDMVKVFAFDSEYSLGDEGVRVRLEGLLLGEAEVGLSGLSLVPSLTLLALADSVNPCTFALFTALLFITLHSVGKKKAALTGFSFIIAIFACYFILGLGVIRVLATVPYVSEAVALAGLMVGIFSVARGLKPRFESPVPKPLRRFMDLQVRKSYVSPLASFVMGAFASFVLLPCSSGPYIVGVGLLSSLNDPFQACLLLILYNSIFVAPLVVILFTVLSSSAYARRIKAFRTIKLGVMELISGLLLMSVCLYLLLS